MNKKFDQVDKIKNDLLKDIEENSIIMFYLDSKGRITVISSGSLSQSQVKIAERMMASVEPSFILLLILKIEILLIKMQEFIYRFFSKK